MLSEASFVDIDRLTHLMELTQHQHHSHQRAQAPPSSHVLHRPRAPSSGIHVHASQQSPRQPPPLQPSQHQAPFPSPHASTHALPPQHPSSFGHAGQASAGAHAQDIPYFATQPSPYSTSSASGTYSSAGESPDPGHRFQPGCCSSSRRGSSSW